MPLIGGRLLVDGNRRLWHNTGQQGRKAVAAKASACLLAAIAVLCETAWAHFPVSVEPRPDDGLLPVEQAGPRDRPVFRVFCVFRGYNTRGAFAADLV